MKVVEVASRQVDDGEFVVLVEQDAHLVGEHVEFLLPRQGQSLFILVVLDCNHIRNRFEQILQLEQCWKTGQNMVLIVPL